MQFGSHDGGEDDEYNGVGFVGISHFFAVQDAYFFRIISFDRVYAIWNKHGLFGYTRVDKHEQDVNEPYILQDSWITAYTVS